MPTMKKVYYIVFDPRLTQRPIHIIEVKREDYTNELEEMEEKLNKAFSDIEKLEDLILFGDE